MEHQIIDAGLQFTRVLTPRTRTTAIVLHHRAGEGDVESIHRQHLSQGWAGIGYNFYIRLDGRIFLGRGWNNEGAHAGSSNDYNAKSIGICFEGNYDVRKEMPEAQYNAGVWLIREGLKLFPTIIEILRHRDVSATACPGRYFPLEKMIQDARVKEDVIMPEIKDINVKVGSVEVKGKQIDDVTYVPLRAFWDAVEAVVDVTWSSEDGAALEMK